MLRTAAAPLCALVALALAGPALAGPSVIVRTDIGSMVAPGAVVTPGAVLHIQPQGPSLEGGGGAVHVGPDGIRIDVPAPGGGSAHSPHGLLLSDPDDGAPFEVDGAVGGGGRTEGAARTFAVRNEGGAPTPPLTVAVRSQEGRGGFAVRSDTCGGRRLPPGVSCAVSVVPYAEGDGRFSGWLRVAAGDDEITLPLVGIADGFDD